MVHYDLVCKYKISHRSHIVFKLVALDEIPALRQGVAIYPDPFSRVYAFISRGSGNQNRSRNVRDAIFLRVS